ncbi:hydroxyethylthiazole kinase [Sediminivirga luteola]|uniref:Hydroxyethylthiazole kinase n=1 Tax=Sediminivirga luteola TaxID=1774748 RepID=A0A8J2TX42_9MICO|nr:hydroxyethylthiazole kinase [Sediminivirga luteola]
MRPLIAPALVKQHQPLIQFITNTVVQQFSANVALALGASPAMVDHDLDAADFARVASGLVVNFGTPSQRQYDAAAAAVPVAAAAGKPWVLDPVGMGIPYRTGQITRTAAAGPSVVRGNASEIAALAGQGSGGRGVESTDEVDAVIDAAIVLALRTGGVVAISGAKDVVVRVEGEEARLTSITGGHPSMPLVIGTGCALGGAVAAYAAAALAGGEEPGPATLARSAAGAHAHFAAAGALAGRVDARPGSFAVAFLDALWELSDADAARIVSLVDLAEETRPVTGEARAAAAAGGEVRA